MEKAIVSFKNPENNREVIISLEYDKENSNIDYDLKLSDNFNMKDQLDFSGFLAKMFIDSLVNNSTEEKKKEDE